YLGPAPLPVLTHDDVIHEPPVQKLEGQRQHVDEIGGENRPRTAVLYLVRKLALGIEGAQMNKRSASHQAAEERDWVIRHIGKIEGQGPRFSDADGHESFRCALGNLAQIGKTELASTKIDRRAVLKRVRSFIEQ